MSAIKDLNIARLVKSAFVELYHKLMAQVEESQTIKTKMTRRYNALKAAAERLFRVAEQTQKSDLTDPIFVLDSQRDILWTSLQHAVLAQTKSLNQEIKEQAVSVQNTLNSLPINKAGQYLRESGQLDTVLSVLLGEKLEKVTAIGVLPIVNLLKDANDEMHRLVDERIVEDSTKPAGAFVEARRLAEEEYHAFVRFVNAYWLINVDEAQQPDPDLENFITIYNSTVDLFNRTQFPGTTKPTDSDNPGDDIPGTDNPGTDNPGTSTPGTGDNNTDNNTGDDNNNGNNPGNENNPSTPGTPSNPSNPNNPDPDDDPDALKPGPGGDDPDL